MLELDCRPRFIWSNILDSMHGNRNTKQRIAGAKNIVRGALSNKDARPVEVLASVIETMAPEDLPAFGKWIDLYPGRRARLAPPAKITRYSDLWTGDYLPFEDIANAMRWNARLLSTHRQTDTAIQIWVFTAFSLVP